MTTSGNADNDALLAELEALRKRNDELEDLLIMASSFKVSPRISVEERGAGKWCVYDMGDVLNSAGEWEYEPRPSERDEDFLQRTRFTREVALHMAKEISNGNKPRKGCPV